MQPALNDHLLAIGIMTGNSLDGADCVLTKFDDDGKITDLGFHHADMPADVIEGLRRFRECVEQAAGNPEDAKGSFEKSTSGPFVSFASLLDAYHMVVADAVRDLLTKVQLDKNIDVSQVDLIGFHGQTCAHFPPSIAKSKDLARVYTVQIGDGQRLADMTGITVVSDFRSDDIMNGGEGAPLAPMHHAHLARHLKQEGRFPLAFCNAGNTGNISVLTSDAEGRDLVLGWDTGPFNHFSDKLMRDEKELAFDLNGDLGASGKINADLLAKLFSSAVLTQDGSNFLMRPPPKSSDPTWYASLPELAHEKIPFADRLQTAQYFSAYIFVHSLTFLSDDVRLPLFFALCGGGWKNRNIRGHFCTLLQDDLDSCVILPEHKERFKELRLGMQSQAVVEDSEFFGYDGTAMEARLMADAAVCRVKAIAFSKTSTTGTAKDTVLGIVRFPDNQMSRASARLQETLNRHQSLKLTTDLPHVFDRRWSRACAGWFDKLSNARYVPTN